MSYEPSGNKVIVDGSIAATGTYYYPSEAGFAVDHVTTFSIGCYANSDVEIHMEAAMSCENPHWVDVTQAFENLSTGTKVVGGITGPMETIYQANGLNVARMRFRVVVNTAPTNIQVVRQVM